MGMKGKIPSLLDIEVGVNTSSHEAAYDIVFIGSFASREDIAEFEQDQQHHEVGVLVNMFRKHRIVVEYEI